MKRISYKPLFKLLIDRDMNRQNLKSICGISPASIAKLGKGENITTDVLVRICNGLNCDLTEIMELEEGISDKERE
ncbi:MAG: helix-turn-helix transcriptional regulator [Clostridia bacterium]|nr:helix-turn-helix transcriptional regulator [Clostridia bacterium]